MLAYSCYLKLHLIVKIDIKKWWLAYFSLNLDQVAHLGSWSALVTINTLVNKGKVVKVIAAQVDRFLKRLRSVCTRLCLLPLSVTTVYLADYTNACSICLCSLFTLLEELWQMMKRVTMAKVTSKFVLEDWWAPQEKSLLSHLRLEL